MCQLQISIGTSMYLIKKATKLILLHICTDSIFSEERNMYQVLVHFIKSLSPFLSFVQVTTDTISHKP